MHEMIKNLYKPKLEVKINKNTSINIRTGGNKKKSGKSISLKTWNNFLLLLYYMKMVFLF